MKRFRQLLYKFSISELHNFIGKDLIEFLGAWSEYGFDINKKKLLIQLYIKIIGTNDLKKSKFRENLLSKLDNDEINSFKSVLGKKYKDYDIGDLIDVIKNKKWGQNDISNHWFKILDVNSNNIEEYNSEKEKIIDNVYTESSFYELLDYQFIIKQKILNLLNSEHSIPRALVHMPTGTGKTKTSMHTLINHYLYNLKREGIIIWMAHTNELIEQAINTFKTTWNHIGKYDVNLIRVYGSNTPSIKDINNGIVFCGFQKLIYIRNNKKELFDKLCERCRLLVVDEAHKSTANQTLGVINQLMVQKAGMLTRGLIGLTATPGRSMNDNQENAKLVALYENKIISIDTELLSSINKSPFQYYNQKVEKDVISYLQDKNILAKIKRQSLNYAEKLNQHIINKMSKKVKNQTNDFNNEFLLEIGEVKARNLVILKKLEELNKKSIPTIVFACSVQHGKLISAALTLKKIKNRCVFGEMNVNERTEAIREFKDRNNDMNILINYEVLTTGFDSTNIRCVFITRPTKSIVLYSQMLGRGLRGPMKGGNEECLLIDIDDNLEFYTSESMAFRFFDNYWSK